MAAIVVNRVLMIAYHFPPYFGSSGLQRTLKFSTYLLDRGWEATVLTVCPMAYPQTKGDQLSEIPARVKVLRTWALDASRHFAYRGAYPGFLARPDRWSSWRLSAVPAGIVEILRANHKMIWSTYPIPSAHAIGRALCRLSGRPWVADFRDMMLEGDFPSDARVRRDYSRIESRTVADASAVVVTTPGTLRLYMDRYPEQPAEKWRCIRNGYDEPNFADVAAINKVGPASRIRLVHSGLLYPSERDPTCFYQAIAELKSENALDASSLSVVLRATGHDEHHQSLIDRYGIGDIVELAEGVAHRKALEEMLGADGLLLFQASNCNNQIPAKLYEYFRAGRPILALTDPDGDTAQAIREAGAGKPLRLTDTADIKAGLLEFLAAIKTDSAAIADPSYIQQYSRQAQAEELANLFDQIVS